MRNPHNSGGSSVRRLLKGPENAGFSVYQTSFPKILGLTADSQVLDTLNILRCVEGSTTSPESKWILSFLGPPENFWTHLRMSGNVCFTTV